MTGVPFLIVFAVAIVIIFGAMIGTFLEATGAALKLADMVVKLVGPKYPELAIELMGWVVSIPMFCDSGFVTLNPIRKAIVKRAGTSSVAMTVCLSAGLYASHANDSYFCVVTNFGEMTLDQGYKTQTSVTFVEGVCSFVFIFILSLLLY